MHAAIVDHRLAAGNINNDLLTVVLFRKIMRALLAG
jgi:hypothetical protein